MPVNCTTLDARVALLPRASLFQNLLFVEVGR
jgi:hypothetical protein